MKTTLKLESLNKIRRFTGVCAAVFLFILIASGCCSNKSDGICKSENAIAGAEDILVLVTKDNINTLSDKNEYRSIMILSTGSNDNSVTLTSVPTDSQVNTDGQGEQFLCNVCNNGDVSLTLDIINQALGTDIQKYITIDSSGVSAIVDDIGGINIDLSHKEAKSVMADMFEGTRTLNGRQAVAYCYVEESGSEYEKEYRQMTVLEAILKKIGRLDISDYITFENVGIPDESAAEKPVSVIDRKMLAKDMVCHISSSMSYEEILILFEQSGAADCFYKKGN